MDGKKVLTGFSLRVRAATELEQMLGEAGLELWQAPEGFWAIRVKPTTPPPAARRPGPARRVRRAA